MIIKEIYTSKLESIVDEKAISKHISKKYNGANYIVEEIINGRNKIYYEKELLKKDYELINYVIDNNNEKIKNYSKIKYIIEFDDNEFDIKKFVSSHIFYESYKYNNWEDFYNYFKKYFGERNLLIIEVNLNNDYKQNLYILNNKLIYKGKNLVFINRGNEIVYDGKVIFNLKQENIEYSTQIYDNILNNFGITIDYHGKLMLISNQENSRYFTQIWYSILNYFNNDIINPKNIFMFKFIKLLKKLINNTVISS